MRLSILIITILLYGCAAAPVGTKYTTPNCVHRCYVHVTVIEANPALTTVTTSATATGGDVARSLGGP